jgi:hypothetical protein
MKLSYRGVSIDTFWTVVQDSCDGDLMEREMKNEVNCLKIERKNENNEMKVNLPICLLYLKSTPGKGRGVYALERISSGSLIHISPVLLFPSTKSVSPSSPSTTIIMEKSPEQEILSHYTYTWGESQALALGLGSMFNHSKRNNVGFILDKEKFVISYHTICNVEKDEELCINYGLNLWFDDAEKEDSTERGEDSDSGDENFLSKFCLIDESFG